MATHASMLAWKIPWTEEPDGLWSMGLQSWTQLSMYTHRHWPRGFKLITPAAPRPLGSPFPPLQILGPSAPSLGPSSDSPIPGSGPGPPASCPMENWPGPSAPRSFTGTSSPATSCMWTSLGTLSACASVTLALPSSCGLRTGSSWHLATPPTLWHPRWVARPRQLQEWGGAWHGGLVSLPETQCCPGLQSVWPRSRYQGRISPRLGPLSCILGSSRQAYVL